MRRSVIGALCVVSVVAVTASALGRSDRRQDRLFGYGVAALLPGLGEINWRCDRDARFHSDLRATRSVRVRVRPAAGAWTAVPQPPYPTRFQAPAQGVGIQRWRISWTAEPASQTITLAINYARTPKSGDCFVRSSVIRTQTTSHSQ